VVHFVKHFRPYLYGRAFTIRTDHASLQWLVNFEMAEGQLARWLEALAEYKYTIQHRPGVKHGNADGLSRQPCTQCGREELSDKAVHLTQLPPKWSDDEIKAAQQADGDISPVYHAIELQTQPSAAELAEWPPLARRYMIDWTRLSVTNGVLRRAWFDNSGKLDHYQIIIPRVFVNEVLQKAHDNLLAGHFAEKRTLLRAREKFYWANMATDIRLWCNSCIVCCARKRKPNRPHHALQTQVVTEPLQRVALDILGPLEPPTLLGNRYVLVIVDYLTKWCEGIPMQTQTAAECAHHFVTNFVCHFGIPMQLHSD
jgi:hypothetical protein